MRKIRARVPKSYSNKTLKISREKSRDLGVGSKLEKAQKDTNLSKDTPKLDDWINDAWSRLV